MTDVRESDALSTGELLAGRYQLLERIGEGGMARVYRALDNHLQRTVAVKVFRDTTDGIGSVERALSETTLLASVSHHALVTVYDAHVSEDDASYFVMEHVNGITLRDLIARGPVGIETVGMIAMDLAEGLHVAHTAGIVHRDIKPSNVLLEASPLPGRTWRAKLADFGIAYLRDSTRVTTPGLLVGTAAYVAPEQARGATPAPPADIYSFGLLLLEALTGRRPFADAEGIGTVVARLVAPPEVPADLPAAWQGLLRGMTALRPDDRPTALDVAIALARTVAPATVDVASIVDVATAPVELPPQAPAGESTAATERMPAPVPPVARRRDARAAGGSARRRPPAPAVTRGGDAARRRRLIGAGVGSFLALLGMLVGALWLSGLPSGAVSPAPSTTTPAPVLQEEQAPIPSEEAPIPSEQAPPTTVPANTSGDNPNSGPGNNSGNGNGNSGNGKGNSGNGNGPGGNNGKGNR
ncbi:serine/threonine-protein kinase [Microbacterium timonense]|uniref:serine/threonine-protein kinase n=1 Tax=Microbacterium timonense TaxID=2086576 RepID=UPI000D10EFE0|nr:serine/threonine-protein kinase [Microbacterium timonense]